MAPPHLATSLVTRSRRDGHKARILVGCQRRHLPPSHTYKNLLNPKQGLHL